MARNNRHTEANEAVVDVVKVVEIDLEYDAYIKKLIAENSDLTVPNSSHSHALSILRAVFEKAEKTIYIYSDALNNIVYNDSTLISNLNQFIKKGGALKVLVKHTPQNNNNFVAALKEHKVDVNKVKDDNFLIIDKEFNNFVVADNKMFRLETDAEYAEAFCNFNNPTMAEKLARIFEHSINSKVSLI